MKRSTMLKPRNAAKAGKGTARPSHQAGFLGVSVKNCKEDPVSYMEPEPAWGKAGANSSGKPWRRRRSLGGGRSSPLTAAERGCPEAAKAPGGDGGCGGVCALHSWSNTALGV